MNNTILMLFLTWFSHRPEQLVGLLIFVEINKKWHCGKSNLQSKRIDIKKRWQSILKLLQPKLQRPV